MCQADRVGLHGVHAAPREEASSGVAFGTTAPIPSSSLSNLSSLSGLSIHTKLQSVQSAQSVQSFHAVQAAPVARLK
jgi:hypothetical protein